MLDHELKDAIEAIDEAAKRGRVSVKLSTHRLEQINRILLWARANWGELEPKVYAWCKEHGWRYQK